MNILQFQFLQFWERAKIAYSHVAQTEENHDLTRT